MKIIGHRGAKGLAPENTLASFRKAIEHNVDEIELDVRVSLDNVAIVQHDIRLCDPSGHCLDVSQTPYQTLLAHKPDLLTLEQALRAINKAVPVIVEVKPRVKTKPVVNVITKLRATGWQDHDILLGSFSQKTLIELHAALPSVPKVVIESWSGIRATLRARKLNTKRISMSKTWLWSGFIKRMEKRGYKVAPYTINDVAKAKSLEKQGVYAVITDFPDRF